MSHFRPTILLAMSCCLFSYSQTDADIAKCLEVAEEVASTFDCTIDKTNSSDGVLRLVFQVDNTENSILMRFVKEGGVVLLASGTKANGLTVRKVQKIEKKYYKKLWKKLLKEVDVKPVSNMSDNMRYLSKY